MKSTNMIKKFLKIIPVLVMIIISGYSSGLAQNASVPSKVKLIKEADGFRVYVNDEPFYMKGAGFEGSDPSSVAKYGGNSIRTWRPGDRFITGQQKLDEAHANGLMVVLGLEVARERHGFDYNDEAAVKKQLEATREVVMKYKDHPALLAWGIGNELNLRYTNKKVWDAVNEISEMIKAIDPNHLTTTMLAGARPEVIQAVAERAPSLDFLSFQLYGSINKLPGYLAESGYEGAYAITEWGVTGHWEVPKTAWNRPIEENSHVQAMAYKDRYQNIIAADDYHCIGSFVFLWGQKQERTPTWYGMFLQSGEKTESVDVMQFLWTGTWPENRAPQMQHFLINGLTAYDDVYLKTNEKFKAEVLVNDPDGDKLFYKWEVLHEVPVDQQSDGGDFEPRPETLFSTETNENIITISAPEKPGEYRLFVYAFDGKNSAATANIPFYVK